MATALTRPHPPHFLKLLAHDVRWGILAALARSDCRVNELVSQLGRPQNLVSYHLQRLRALKLVAERRSAADGRDVYYRLDLDKIRSLYLASGGALHPALTETNVAPTVQATAGALQPARVLFLCTHNSARSQMAEGLLRHLSRGRAEAFSAGSEPTVVHRLAIRMMDELGIDIRGQRSKPLDEYRGHRFDYIITVCDRVREVCPAFPGDPEQIHWSFPDPVEASGNAQQYRALKDTATQLTTRINYLLLMIERAQRGQ